MYDDKDPKVATDYQSEFQKVWRLVSSKRKPGVSWGLDDDSGRKEGRYMARIGASLGHFIISFIST